VVANAREVLVEKAAGGLGVALEEGRDHGGMLLVILAAQRLRHALLLQAVPVRLVAGGVDGLAIVDEQRVLGGAEDGKVERRVPMLELGRALSP
jgi:hypothetical protein